MEHPELPGLAAIFVVVFDQKVGYTISWKRAITGVDLDGVEYKSLPSGLHTVKHDLVYFSHEPSLAGVSLFEQSQADDAHRNANFVVVGALAPLTNGLLGRNWTHSGALRKLAKEMSTSLAPDYRGLELYWAKHKLSENALSEQTSSSAPSFPVDNKKRKRAYSEVTVDRSGAQDLMAADHPALAAAAAVEIFGPLLFPLHRAALTRKRILMMGNAPVQPNCNAVYLISVLSNVSHSLVESMPTDIQSLLKSRPLYNVGIHDIPALEAAPKERGWLACTTDDILGEKKGLWDLLVQLNPVDTNPGRPWPALRTANGEILKASQRDLRRWRMLKTHLEHVKRQIDRDNMEERDPDNSDAGDSHPLITSTGNDQSEGLRQPESHAALRDPNETVESSTWSALAYKGFMWWASAGEASTWENDEIKLDEELFLDMPDFTDMPLRSPTSANRDEEDIYTAQCVAAVVVSYFRRLSEKMLQTLANIVEQADDMTEEGVEKDALNLHAEDVREAGLDAWSDADKDFVVVMMRLWLGHEASISDGVTVCGVRVC